MMDSLPDHEDLINLVEELAPDSSPLEMLTDSVVLSGRMSDLGDELVGHFVELARRAGASWAEIGESMGVSKQAAQKRFATRAARRARGGFFVSRFAEEARHVVRGAVDHARTTGASHVGTEHLVRALIQDPEGLVSRAVTDLGGSREAILAADHADTAPTRRSTRGGGHIPFSDDSKKVLELALREAVRRSDRRIDEEHILLGILRDAKSPGARLLTSQGVTLKKVDRWLDEG